LLIKQISIDIFQFFGYDISHVYGFFH